MKRCLIPIILVSLVLGAGCSSRYRSKIQNITPAPIWPYHRGEASSSGAMPEGTFPGSLEVVWEFNSKAKAAGPLTIYYDHLVYPGAKNKIQFFDLQSGLLTGFIKPKGHPQSGMVARKNLAFFATGPRENQVKCVDIGKSKKMWSRGFVDASSGMMIVDKLLILGSSVGVLLALDVMSGDEVWRFSAESKFNVPATFADGVLYQPGDDGILYVLNPEDGEELYRVELSEPIVSPVAVSDYIYVATMTGHVYALDPKDGATIWSQELGGPIWTSPALSDGMVFLGHSGGEVVAIDAASGDIVWSYRTVDVVRASPLVVGEYVIVGTLAGKVYSLSTFDGSVVAERELGGPISVAPVTDGSRVFVATDKGMITCFGAPLLSETAEN